MAECKNLKQSCKLKYIHGPENIFGLTIKLIYLNSITNKYMVVTPFIVIMYNSTNKHTYTRQLYDLHIMFFFVKEFS